MQHTFIRRLRSSQSTFVFAWSNSSSPAAASHQLKGLTHTERQCAESAGSGSDINGTRQFGLTPPNIKSLIRDITSWHSPSGAGISVNHVNPGWLDFAFS